MLPDGCKQEHNIGVGRESGLSRRSPVPRTAMLSRDRSWTSSRRPFLRSVRSCETVLASADARCCFLGGHVVELDFDEGVDEEPRESLVCNNRPPLHMTKGAMEVRNSRFRSRGKHLAIVVTEAIRQAPASSDKRRALSLLGPYEGGVGRLSES